VEFIFILGLLQIVWMNFNCVGGKTRFHQSFAAFSPLKEVGMKLRRQERDDCRTYTALRISSAGA